MNLTRQKSLSLEPRIIPGGISRTGPEVASLHLQSDLEDILDRAATEKYNMTPQARATSQTLLHNAYNADMHTLAGHIAQGYVNVTAALHGILR